MVAAQTRALKGGDKRMKEFAAVSGGLFFDGQFYSVRTGDGALGVSRGGFYAC
jgi:hypothetical protein